MRLAEAGLATLLAAAVVTAPTAATEPLTVATLNVHYIVEDGDGPLPWTPRREAVAKSVRESGADIIGFQEMETFAGGSWST
ncbi:MAG: hypothetical protein GVY29_05935, partial [Spirochaetes bacterium]|nr:hypothetical protein [Spirochaetota bacterium]